MQLKQVTIAGFKSFAVRTALSFAPTSMEKQRPMTAIVGPNGSGKSNVSDAIRWVMGEQSMKSLRGKKSEDVIFAGSEAKGKQSMAHVTLLFDNKDKKIPIDYDEVTVERKMYRSGEGEYLINGARVRLMDVVDLLAQAGLGKNSYCVVGQGMTDAILGATPIERKGMIEDAAGVKHFQIKKQRSEKKLEKTKENLARTYELIAEIEPHLKLLKRQSEKAAKSKEVHAQLTELQRDYFGYMWRTFKSERTSLEEGIEGRKQELDAAEAQLAEVVGQIQAEAQKVENASFVGSLEGEKNEMYKKLRTCDQEIARAESRIEIEGERRAHEQRVKSIPVDLGYVRTQLSQIQTRYDNLIQELERAQTSEDIDNLKDGITEIKQLLGDLHSDAGKKTVALPPEDNSEVIAAIDVRVAENETEKEKWSAERTQVQKHIAEIDEKIAEEIRSDQQAREQFFVLEKNQRHAQDVINAVREKYNAIKIQLARLEVREDDVRTDTRNHLQVEVESLLYEGVDLDTEGVEAQINKLRREYEQIGGIDPLVIEEYQETQERYDFLSQESQDLEQAIISLKEVIKEMDKKIHDAFVKAYKEINAEFTKYFRILFGGGNAKLTQTKIAPKSDNKDAENPDASEDQDLDGDEEKAKSSVEVGVEIEASPPGKKVKQLSLLSGGERSLTSIAMLFAIIAYNPPPFTVLDEVEAALDEANSRRLARIFAELSEKTQFIIITHNRETMRHADMLYGVTMANDGASQILSVKLDQLDKDE